jgi:hypothetical protein
MPTTADRTSLLLVLPVLAGVLVLGSCAGAPGVKTVTVTSAHKLDPPTLQIAPGQGVTWASREAASDLVIEFYKDGAPQVRGTGAAPVARFDKPGRYPYALLTRLMTPSGPGGVERMLGEIVVGVPPPTSEPKVPEPSSTGPDVVRLRSSPDAARVYEYRAQQGIVIKIERTAVSPNALRAGEQVVLEAQYTLLVPPESGQVKIKEIWVIRFASSELGRMEKHAVLGSGTYTSQQRLKLPEDAPAGNYMLTTRIEAPQAGTVTMDQASAALVVRPRSP